MFIHASKGTFEADARVRVAAELTELGMRCERLPDVPSVKSNVWIYFNEYEEGEIFSGGMAAKTRVMSLIVYALEGGLDEKSRSNLIAGATEILGRHSGFTAPVPAYVVINEVPEASWGMFGQAVNLEKMRKN
jgi:phenylpyruvate tautomerase PptA (4-oxalocrotonate tautomerase family)